MESIHFKCYIRIKDTGYKKNFLKVLLMTSCSPSDLLILYKMLTGAWALLDSADWLMSRVIGACHLLTNDNMMLILLTLIMFIFYFLHSHLHSHHHHRRDHSGFLYHMIIQSMLLYSPTNPSSLFKEIIRMILLDDL